MTRMRSPLRGTVEVEDHWAVLVFDDDGDLVQLLMAVEDALFFEQSIYEKRIGRWLRMGGMESLDDDDIAAKNDLEDRIKTKKRLIRTIRKAYER